MHHLERVRRGGAAPVRSFDQRRAHAALRGVESGCRTEHATADHHEIELVARQCREITLHRSAQRGAVHTAASFLVRTFTSLP